MRPSLPARPGADGGAAAPIAAAANFLSRLRRPSTVLVAVSGGSDSIGLLFSLHQALTLSGAPHRLVACTVDHALRAASAAEAAAVSQRCRALGVPHHVARWSHADITSGLQAQARLARYRLLSEAAHLFGADLVVTAHTADDQAETIAMRAARHREDRAAGRGAPIGLAGMADAVLFDGRLWICRPFLGVGRQAVRDALTARGEGWIDDPSNDDPRFERVRIRRGSASPASPGPSSCDPDDGLACGDAAAGRIRSGALLSGLLARHVRIAEGVAAEIALADLDVADDAWRRLLVLLAATLAGKPHGIGRDSAARLVSALGDPAATATTAGGCVFERRAGRLFVYRERRNLPVPTTVAPGQSLLWDGRFTIDNTGLLPITILAGGDRALAARLAAQGLPAGVAGRIAQAAPAILGPDGGLVPDGAFSRHPRIAPYDTFLPRFDLMIGQSIAAKLGRAPYPECPVDDIAMK
ncbi:tRNA lysidine(34) synthetase TilS [Rhizobium sp. Leaf341]|uniref:tRNA lysidine(34) synthetase TilS n=1 Tax=Rhizobium sp. Leaf341 TaxID=1736344 RepID=UPI0007151BCF|nr:tRNA lysidine(34) synthetase TilS [Rhizobium sp. Leaf341]KQR75807.1 hypothetical protein ASG03_19265 [Rhizobium sp. Leaf341]